ncbi:MAG: FAD-dependent oxidoreductase [Pseudomonadota bacterium]
MRRVVVIGAGQAGLSCAAKLRAEGFDGEITLIGDEPLAPYQRPPLSKAYLLGDMPLERLFLRPEAFYAEQEIALRLGAPVTGIDPGAKQVALAGETLDYDDLVLATGARARPLPEDQGGALGGVFTIRDLADIDRLAPEMRQGRRLLVIGGGYIGLEAAAVARKLGLEVVLVEAAPRILGRVACVETADYFRALHQGHGVEIREGVGLASLLGDDQVTGAELSDGTRLDCDLAIVGIGITPETELAAAAGVALDQGIAVNAMGQTSVPGIWAAGDCASLPFEDTRVRLESVQNAIDQAEAVARNILGAEAAYLPRPWFWSDQYDVKLQIAGLAREYDGVVVRDGGKAVSHWYFRGSRLIAVDAMSDPRGYMIGKRLVEAGAAPDQAVIADPAGDLKGLLRA